MSWAIKEKGLFAAATLAISSALRRRRIATRRRDLTMLLFGNG